MGNRNYEIAFIKIMATIIICLLHHSILYSNGFFRGGYIVVELFFMISGFFLTQHAMSESLPCLTGGERQAIIRIKRFFPYIIIAFMFYYPLFLSFNIESYAIIAENEILTQSFYLLGMYMLGAYADGSFPVSHAWYIYALIIASSIVYPFLIRMKRDGSFGGWYPLIISMVLYGFLWIRYSSVQCDAVASIDHIVIVYPLIFRALAGMLLGVFIYYVFLNIHNVRLTQTGRLLCKLIELILLAITVYIMQIKAFSKWDFFIILLFVPILIIAFSYSVNIGSDYIKRIIVFFEQLSLPVYLMQNVSAYIVKIFNTYIQIHDWINAVMFWGILIFLAFIARWIVLNIFPYLKQRIKNEVVYS